MVTQTSKEAYLNIIQNLANRQWSVYKALREIQPANNRMISQHMKLPINHITPRVKELRDRKLVGVDSVREDHITNRTTIFWRIVK